MTDERFILTGQSLYSPGSTAGLALPRAPQLTYMYIREQALLSSDQGTQAPYRLLLDCSMASGILQGGYTQPCWNVIAEGGLGTCRECRAEAAKIDASSCRLSRCSSGAQETQCGIFCGAPAQHAGPCLTLPCSHSSVCSAHVVLPLRHGERGLSMRRPCGPCGGRCQLCLSHMPPLAVRHHRQLMAPHARHQTAPLGFGRMDATYIILVQVRGQRLQLWPHVTALLRRPQPRAAVAAWPSSAPCCRSTPALSCFSAVAHRAGAQVRGAARLQRLYSARTLA
jgi:hypothetical protein